MATKNIDREIICEHKKECRSYSVWVGDGRNSKCRSCMNNQYKDPESIKIDYYKANASTKIGNVIVTLMALGVLLWFGYWVFNISVS